MKTRKVCMLTYTARYVNIYATCPEQEPAATQLARGTRHPFGSKSRVYSTFDQKFDFKIRIYHQKNSYERRVCGR